MCIACKPGNDRTNPDLSFDTDLKLPADRLDPETVAVRVDVKRIVGWAIVDRAERVEVGVHRGVWVDGDECSADLGHRGAPLVGLCNGSDDRAAHGGRSLPVLAAEDLHHYGTRLM